MVVDTGILATPSTPGLRDSHELRLFVLSRKVSNCRPQTIETYQRHVWRFLSFAQKPALDVNRADVELYLLSVQERCSPHYVRACYRNLRVFFSWLVNEEMLGRSPMRNIPCPKVPRHSKEFLSREDFDKLLAVCPHDFRGARNIAWLWLLWSTGCRVEGLFKLRLADLDWDKSRIKVVEKGDKERYVPFTPDAQRAVYRYLKARQVYVGKKDHYQELWIGEERKPLGFNGIRQIIRILLARAGLHVRDQHHIFRRTWAYRNLKAGVPVKFVQLVGGWSNLATMEVYVRAMQSDDAMDVEWH
jgi:integrase/recombinase XerD